MMDPISTLANIQKLGQDMEAALPVKARLVKVRTALYEEMSQSVSKVE